MTEAQFQQQVEQLARFYGWRVFHAPDNRPVRSRRGTVYVQKVQPGWPDLFAIRGPEIIVAELKTDTGRVSPEQLDWLDAFRAFGAACVDALTIDSMATPMLDVYVWRPRDFDQLHARLASGRHRQEPTYRDRQEAL